MDQQNKQGLIAAGNFIVDQVKLIDTYPQQDQLALVQSHSRHNGGGPYNLLRDLSAMGAGFPLYAVGSIGDDPEGQWIIEDCQRRGIDHRGLRITAQAGTSWTDVMTVASTGRRTFFHYPGANAHLGVDEFDFSASTARIFYLGYLTVLDTLDAFDTEGRTGASRVLELASQAGLITAADLVSRQHPRFRDTVASSAPHIDFLFLNELEAGWILDQRLEVQTFTSEDLLQAASSLLSLGVRRAVIVHFEYGAVYAGTDGTRLVQSAVRLPDDLIRSKLGAGDAFSAGFLHAIQDNKDAPAALLSAACVAASCLTAAAASDGIKPLRDCLAMADEFGFHSDF